MVPRNLLVVLVVGLPVLVVGFAVLMGGAGVAMAAGDPSGARILVWVAISFVMLFLVDIVLLVGALGVNALAAGDQNYSRNAQNAAIEPMESDRSPTAVADQQQIEQSP